MKKKKCAAVIAAAGLSSRMNDFKPMLCIDGQSVIMHLVSSFQKAGVSDIVIVSGYKSEIIKKHLGEAKVLLVENKNFAATDMFCSVCLGLSSLKKEYDVVLVSPGDIPLIQSETIRRLSDDKSEVTVPVFEGRSGHPVKISGKYVKDICAYSGDGGLRKALESLPCEINYLEVDDPFTSQDMDTPEDYRRLKRMKADRGGLKGLYPEVEVNISTGGMLIDPRTALLLEMIDHTGSLQNACACVHMSYTSAWTLLRGIEHELGFKLLERLQGGSFGGGSRLTDEGRKLLKQYRKFRQDVNEYAKKSFGKCFNK